MTTHPRQRLGRRLIAAGVLAFLLALAAVSVAPTPLRQVASARAAASGGAVSVQMPLPAPKPQASAAEAIQVFDIAALDLSPAPEKTPLAAEKPKTEAQKEVSPQPQKPVQSPVRPRPQPLQQPKHATPKTIPVSASDAAPAVAPSAASPGELPGLVVDYTAIGFDRYARFTEQAGGAFFVYTGGADLSHKVSIGKESPRILPGDTTGLALDRLYLISDAAIAERLQGVRLPERAQSNVVVMAWPRWLDRKVWDMVLASLNDGGFKPKTISRVDARVRDTGVGLELKMESVTLRDGNRRIPLAKPRAVRIQS